MNTISFTIGKLAIRSHNDSRTATRNSAPANTAYFALANVYLHNIQPGCLPYWEVYIYLELYVHVWVAHLRHIKLQLRRFRGSSQHPSKYRKHSEIMISFFLMRKQLSFFHSLYVSLSLFLSPSLLHSLSVSRYLYVFGTLLINQDPCANGIWAGSRKLLAEQ